MDLLHACRRTKEDTRLLPHHYARIGMLQLQTRTNQILLYDSLQGPNLACDLEQLDYTPGEEEIMTIYKDGVY